MKFLLIYIICYTVVLATIFNNQILQHNSLVLQPQNYTIDLSYLYYNDDIDVLHLKDQELTNKNTTDTIGNMYGLNFQITYGLIDKDSIFFKYKNMNINFGQYNVSSNIIEIFNRYNIIDYQYRLFDLYSIDIGIINNNASDINIRSDKQLNSFVKKLGSNNIKFNNGSIIKDDLVVEFYKHNKKIYPYIKIANLHTDELYIRFLLSKRFATIMTTLYYTIDWRHITSQIDLVPDDHPILNSLLDGYTFPNLNRTELINTIGLNSVIDFQNYLVEMEYCINQIESSDNIDYVDKSSLLKLYISKSINKIQFYSGIVILFNQFRNENSYLYNKYTKYKFDKKYGYITLGVHYMF